jgi:hypothetical protein
LHLRHLWRERRQKPWYVSFDYTIPGNKGSLGGVVVSVVIVVVTARFINTLKTNLTEKQFLAVMAELAKHLEGAPFDIAVLGD